MPRKPSTVERHLLLRPEVREALLLPVSAALSYVISRAASADWFVVFSLTLAVLTAGEATYKCLTRDREATADADTSGPAEIPREAVSGFVAAMLILVGILLLIALLR